MSGKTRVVVTGIGAITPVGIGRDKFWQALKQGKSGVKRVEDQIDLSGIECKIAAPVENFNPLVFMSEQRAGELNRACQFAIAATSEALKDAQIDFEREPREKIGVVIGVGIGEVKTLLENHLRILEKRPDRISPLFVAQFMPNTPSAEVAIEWGFEALNFSVVSACASSTHAIGLAALMIGAGFAKIVVAGGTDALIDPLVMAGFDRMGALSRQNKNPQKASRPFDRDRDGFVLGEGAGVFILEDLEHAQSRGAPIYAELLGIGMNDDAFHITAPDPEGEGAVKVMEMALQRAGLGPEDVNYINAHGTSTPLNDAIETKAIKKVFGKYAHQIPVSATKSMTGHLLGAAGAIEAVATVMALQGVIHQTLNLEHPDEGCDLDYVAEGYREADVKIALSNSFGFGGHNACLALGKLRKIK